MFHIFSYFRHICWVKQRTMQRNLSLLKRLKNSQSKNIAKSENKFSRQIATKSKNQPKISKKNVKKSENKLSNAAVTNHFGVPLVPPNLQEKLFGCPHDPSKLDEETKKKAETHLEDCNVNFSKKVQKIENVPHIPLIDSLDFAKDISAHFHEIGQKQAEPFIQGMLLFNK